jgi:DMSO/TMAO reductase YedYZ molybdopterin-dependent catalytic subunit
MPSGDTQETLHRLSRRGLLQQAAATGMAASDSLAGGATPAVQPDLRESFDLDRRLVRYDQYNYGTPLDAIDGLIVPNDLFYVRNSAPVPQIEPHAWRLRIGGLVETPLNLTLDDLKALPHRTITAFLECSGNSRSFFVPETTGTPWGNTSAGNAEWTGTPLGSVLALAGIQPGAVEIVSQGGDSPEMQRGLPLGKALDPDTLLVWAMNGEDLPPVHGAPVRLIVPGWGGIASTKWLVGIEVIDHVFTGPLNTDSYTIVDTDGHRVRPVREMPVKSVIATPGPGAVLAAGPQTLRGYAWSGYGQVTAIDVSTDGGASWAAATILEAAGNLSWVRFEAHWDATPGQAVLSARATDSLMMTQPDEAPWNARGYGYNAVFNVPVSVE